MPAEQIYPTWNSS